MGEAGAAKRLIQFLYKDLAFINSVLSQLMPGVLEEVATSRESSRTTSSQIEGNAYVVQGTIGEDKTSTQGLLKRYAPYDQVILDLLTALNIEPHNGSLSDTGDGQLVLLKGALTIRNFETLKTTVPKLNKANLLGLKAKDARAFESMFSIVPMGLEMDMYTNQGESIIGTLKGEYLTISPDDLLRIYGNYIPGEWYALGVVDCISTERENLSQFTDSDLRMPLDQYAEGIRLIYNQGYATHAIVPMLIFRELVL
jgi:hypothetical protein